MLRVREVVLATEGAETTPAGFDQAAQDALIIQHRDLVRQVVDHVAARFPRHIDREELRGAGTCGLVEAARRYDPEAGVPFPHFARIRIRGAVLDATRSRDWVARSVRRHGREVREAEEKLEAMKGRRPGEDEVARELGITPGQLTERRATGARSLLLHLDRRFGDEESLGESLQDEDESVLPEAILEKRELLGTLRTAVRLLPGVQRQVVERHYVVGEMLQDIAESMGVTEARVSQICSEAVNAIRAHLGTMYEGVPDVAERAPGRRSRTAFVKVAGAPGRWKDVLAAAEGEWVVMAEVGSGV